MRLWFLFFVAITIHLITLSASADEREKKPIADDWKRDNAIAARTVWPSFRGRAARGIAVGQHLPEQWNTEKGEGVRWKTPIPGLGNSCPVVWKEKVFVTTAVSSAGITKLKIDDVKGSAVEYAEVLFPQQLSIHVVAVKTTRIEQCDHMLAVGGRCRVGLARFRMTTHRRYTLMGDTLPENATRCMVKTIQPPRMF